nr:DUF4099 domain-containing protein [uncultured Mucilaginibacter sp.]
MIRQIFERQELPMEELQKLGLADGAQLHLDEDDLNALLAGRRTDMLRLENLDRDGLHIPALDAKLSLRRRESGALELLAHPIYKQPDPPSFLTDTEAGQLENGEAVNVLKTIPDGEGDKRDVLVEFDKDTNEFIVVNTDQVTVPEEINGKPLTPEQKERYRKGKEVTVDDGTTIQYSAKDKQAVRSDRLALIASVLIDGGVSYMLYKGLNALFNRPQREPGNSFHQTLASLPADQAKAFIKKIEPDNDADEEYTETLSR